VELTEAETRQLLQRLPAVYRTQVNEVLLAGLGEALGEWTGSRRVIVEVEGHGREEVFDGADLSRTIGWFTTMGPVVLERSPGGDPAATLRAMRRRLRGLPTRLLDYGLLRWLGAPEVRELLAAALGAEVTFNYLGQWDGVARAEGLLQASDRTLGIGMAPDEPRPHLLDVTAMVTGGRLRVDWVYSREVHRRETVTRWAERMLEVLRGF
jgi:non-ribosomal peptide synthase protein (TIGR01720 family)